ncbi:MAG TPA: hypothetical protein VH186_00270 [Chloroflexia bacterium]|nr:hypothetical protein [Chloroflexia bacterium]
MLKHKVTLVLFLCIILAALLAACGSDNTSLDVSATIPAVVPATAAVQATGGSAGQAESQPAITSHDIISGTASAAGSVQKPASTGAANPAQPSPAPAGKAASLKSANPCTLFTKDDFAAVFGKAAADPDHYGTNTSEKCNYGFAEQVGPDPDLAYGLEIDLSKQVLSKQQLDIRFQQYRRGGFQDVSGAGDAALFHLSSQPDESSVLLVVKGERLFTLTLIQPQSVSGDQIKEQLVNAAQKIASRL